MTSSQTPVSSSAPLSPFRLLLAIVFALTFARLAALSVTGLELHGDEAQYWSWAQRLDWGYFTKPPMIAWVIAGATALCGDAAWCVRAPSPIFHAATALGLWWVARGVFREHEQGAWIAFWAGALWITLPAVSYSSLLVSTDVPLLFFWTIAVGAWWRMLEQRNGIVSWEFAALAGAAIGLGLLSKYAMSFLLIGLFVHALIDRDRRWVLRDAKIIAVVAVGGLVILPNILWNLQNDFATVRHLGDNANLKGELFRPLKALEFFGQQFGVFGPIPFAILIWRAVAWARGQASRAEVFLLCVALPPLIVVTGQALLSRANANWGVTAYPAATVLVAAVLVTYGRTWLKGWTIGPHLVAGLVVLIVASLWPVWQPPLATKGLARLAGWNEMARQIRPVLATYPDLPVMLDDRMTMGALLYTMRHELVAADRSLEGTPGRPVWMWDWNYCPEHHYEQTSRFDPDEAQPILYLSAWDDPGPIVESFAEHEPVGIYTVDAYGRSRTLRAFILGGYHGHWTPPEGRLPCGTPGQPKLWPRADG